MKIFTSKITTMDFLNFNDTPTAPQLAQGVLLIDNAIFRMQLLVLIIVYFYYALYTQC